MISRQNCLFLVRSILLSLFFAEQSFSLTISRERNWKPITRIFLPLLHLFPFLSFVRILITYHISTIRLPIYLPTYLSTCLPACLPACLPPYLPTCLPTYLSTYPPTYRQTYLPVRLPVYLHVHLLAFSSAVYFFKDRSLR